MTRKNDGKDAASIFQNQFTAYYMKAIRSHKQKYHLRRKLQRQHEIPFESEYTEFHATNMDFLEGLHIWQQIEDKDLFMAIAEFRERNASILYMKVIEEKSFGEIAGLMGMPEASVKTAYYRLLGKLKAAVKADDK